MNLSFNFDKMQTAVIYADDDPEYMVGRKVSKEHEALTEEEKWLQRLFLGVISCVKQHGSRVDIDRLIEAVRDYVTERRMAEKYGPWRNSASLQRHTRHKNITAKQNVGC